MAPPWSRGELCGVHGPQRQARASPFLSDNIHTIGMLLKMLVLDRGGAAAAADNVDNGGLLYGNDDNDNGVNDTE